MQDDLTLFLRQDMIDLSWKFVTSMLNEWEKSSVEKVHSYEAWKYKIHIATDTDALIRTSAEIILQQLTEVLQKKNFFTVALSGGSTPKRLYTLLSNNDSYLSQIQWDRIHFFWSDERYVPPDHRDSNYKMAKESMLSRVPVPEENIHRIKAENPDIYSVVEEYENEMRLVFQLEAGQLPQFDCILLGMGTD